MLFKLAGGLRQNDEDVFVIARVGNGIRAAQAVATANGTTNKLTNRINGNRVGSILDTVVAGTEE